jgi:hypothetical protein
LQIVEGLETAVPPGGGVTAPGVVREEVGVDMNSVGVTEGSTGAGVAGAPQPAKRINAAREVKRVLVFMLISSFVDYIPCGDEQE